MNQKLKCIMLIDDDEPTNFLSSMIIESAGCTEHIEVADGGQKAINYLISSQQSGFSKAFPWPDLIFLDINMPAMNGWEFLEKYKELEKKAQHKVVIIMLTTSLNPDDRVKALNVPVSAFEIKPFTPELLDKVIEKFFTAELVRHTKNFVE